jgi:hypothetical protein
VTVSHFSAVQTLVQGEDGVLLHLALQFVQIVAVRQEFGSRVAQIRHRFPAPFAVLARFCPETVNEQVNRFSFDYAGSFKRDDR